MRSRKNKSDPAGPSGQTLPDYLAALEGSDISALRDVVAG